MMLLQSQWQLLLCFNESSHRALALQWKIMLLLFVEKCKMKRKPAKEKEKETKRETEMEMETELEKQIEAFI